MNKNKKRLSKLLVSMLALSGMNVNAMEGAKPTVRGKSFSKKRSSMKGEVLQEDEAKKRDNRAYVVQYSGPALNEFLQDFEYVGDSLKPTGQIFGGNAGIVTKCRRKKDGRIFAVKCEPNPRTTGIQTINNATLHANDNDNETQFYEDVKTLWKNSKWAVKCHKKYNDGYVSYTVTDFVDGVTLNDWISGLPLTKQGMEKLALMLRQYNQIIDDLSAQGKMNSGMHEDNLMVIKDKKNPEGFQLKLVDNGRYQIGGGENVEERHARQIRRLLNLDRLCTLWDELYDANEQVRYSNAHCDGRLIRKPSPDEIRLSNAYHCLVSVLACINARWSTTRNQIRRDSNSEGSYSKRHELPNKLYELAKCLDCI